MVKAPNVVQVSPKGSDPRETEGYDWAGEPNPSITIKCSGIEADLSANYNTKSRIPESVRVQNFRGAYNIYDRESILVASCGLWRCEYA